VTIDDPRVRDIKVKQMEELVGTLAHLPYRVTRVEHLAGVAGVGESSRAKVEEILRTGHLALTDGLLARADVRTKMEFCKVRAGVDRLSSDIP
jgi:hypothetical protein